MIAVVSVMLSLLMMKSVVAFPDHPRTRRESCHRNDRMEVKRSRLKEFRIAMFSPTPIRRLDGMDTLFEDVHFELESLNLRTSLPAQPVGLGATREGAMRRAIKAKRRRPHATIWVGVENGMYRDVPKGLKDPDPFSHWFDIGRLVIIYEGVEEDAMDSASDGSRATLPIVGYDSTRISRRWSESFPIPESRARNCLVDAKGTAARNDGTYKWSHNLDAPGVSTGGCRSRTRWIRDTLKEWIIDNFNEITLDEWV